MTRILDFSDGFESASEPDAGIINANAIKRYANDGAFEADNGSGENGDMYYNTTLSNCQLMLPSRWFLR